MKTVGIIGGLSWTSTAEYYRLLNENIQKRLGGLHSAKLLISSFDFQEVLDVRESDDSTVLAKFIEVGLNFQKMGAGLILFAANGAHRFADDFEKSCSLPLIHIVDVISKAAHDKNLTKLGLLGTKLTMESKFYLDRLKHNGIDCIIPSECDRNLVNSIIFDELCIGKIVSESRKEIVKCIAKLEDQGAQGVILGCTELPLLIQQSHTPVPILDSTVLHIQAVVKLALA